MRKIIAAGVASVMLAGVASAADPGFFFPGGARQDSVFHAPGTTMDGKTVSQWGAQIDANATAASTANAGVSTNETAISAEATRAKDAENTNATAAATAQTTANTAVTNAATAQTAADAAQTTANSAIPLTQKGAASGVAPLDADGNSTAPVLTASFNKNGYTGVRSPLQTSGGNVSSVSTPNALGVTSASTAGQDFDNWIFPGSLMVGAQRRHAHGVDKYDDNIGGTLIMRHKPDGYFDLGCVRSTGATEKSAFSMRAPIASDEMTASGIAGYKTLDTAVDCDMSELLPATISSQVSNFTENTVTLATPLTEDQISRLHYGMYIITNVINPSVSQNGPSTTASLDSPNFYVTTLTGWSSDGTTLNVVGWAVPGGGQSTVGTPTTVKNSDGTYTNLDSRWGSTTYTVPMVFIGASTQIEGQNIFALYDPSAISNSFNHWFTGTEYDIAYNGKDGDASVVGTSYNFVGSGAPAAGSAAIVINGNIPNGIINQVPCTGIETSAYEFTANGCGGVLGFTAASRSMMFKSQNYTDRFSGSTGDIVSLQSYMQRDSTATASSGGFTNSSLHLGAFLNNAEKDVTALTGSQIADITFGYPGYKNGIALCPGSTDASGTYSSCMRVDNYGNMWMPSGQKIILNHALTDTDTPELYSTGPTGVKLDTVAGNGVVFSTYQVNSDILTTTSTITSGGNISISKAGGQLIFSPPTGSTSPFVYASDGTNLQYSNSAGDGIVLNPYGVKAEVISSGSQMIIPFGTPSSSTAACTEGQIEMDATYTYSCVAANTWHRVSNGATW